MRPRVVFSLWRGALEPNPMRTCLRSVVATILGKVPGKTSRLDTATRMVMDADFSDRYASMLRGLPRSSERDDEYLIKPLSQGECLDPGSRF